MRSLLGLIVVFLIFSASIAYAQLQAWDDHFAIKRATGYIRDVVVTDSSFIVAGELDAMGGADVHSVAELNVKRDEWSKFSYDLALEERASIAALLRDSLGTIYFYKVPGASGLYKLSGGVVTKLQNIKIGTKANGKMSLVAGRNTLYGWSDTGELFRLDDDSWTLIAEFCLLIEDTCMPPGSVAYPIREVLPVGDSVFVLTECNRVNGKVTSHIALYDGVNWSSLPGFNEHNWLGVSTIAFHNHEVYLTATYLDTLSGEPAKWIAKWNGTSWISMNSSPESPYQLAYPPTSLAFVKGKIYALGRFVDGKGSIYADVASWNGRDWVPEYQLGADKIFEYHDELYAYDRDEVWHISGPKVRVAGFADPSKHLGLSGSVLSFANLHDSLWVTGFLTHKELDSFEQLAFLKNGVWKQGIGGFVNHAEGFNTLASDYGRLYFAGRFPDYQGMNCNSILQWNGKDWVQLGSGFRSSTEEEGLGSIEGLLVTEHGVIASGIFDTAGGKYAQSLARWDGNEWHPFNNQQSVVTNAMLEYHDTLIVGKTSDLDPVQEYPLAFWDGSRFLPWPTLPNNKVTSIQKFGQGFVIGGYFDSVGNLPARGIAYWDGEKWNAFDTSVPPYVNAIKVNGDELYVAGREVFSKWDGVKWVPMVADLKNKEIYALEIVGNKLYVGGYFRSLDGVPSMNIGSTTIESKADVHSSEQDHPGVDIFPNPANSIVRIEGANTPRTVKFIDLLGQTVLEVSKMSSSEIDVSTLPSGSYFIHVESIDGITSVSSLQILR